MRRNVRKVTRCGVRPLGFLLGFLLLFTWSAQAQEPPSTNGGSLPEVRSPVAPLAQAGVRTGEIQIDGRIDEEAWQTVPVASGFVQREPFEGEPAEQDTHVRVLVDEEAIYVAARMFEPDTAMIRRPLVRRGQGGAFQDWFSISLDTNHDGRTSYRFQVSAAGVQVDWYHYDDDQSDGSWDGVWQSAVAVDSLGWTAEMRIPLSQVRYESSAEPQTWGVNFQRRRSAAAEVSHFALERRTVSGTVSQYGTLEDVFLPSQAHRIEARPYVSSSFHQGPAEEGNPFFDGREVGFRAGSDFRFGLGSAFTLDATVNPDFGQVEADPSEINLSAFESFFRERRPFFIEDAQVFDFRLSGRQNRLFYSRRIGGAPHGRAPSGATFVDVPDGASILGAAKVTGRTSSGLAMGALGALTRAETGVAFFPEEGRSQEFLAEPRAGYGVVAAQQDLNQGASQVRALVTLLDRSLPTETTLALPEQAFSVGVAFEHQWSDRMWRLDGSFAGSHVRGSPAAITAIQRSSSHYFQRPDATRIELDPSATSLSGAEWRLSINRQNREHWTGSAWVGQVANGFEVNDLGFNRNRERLNSGFRYGYRQVRPGSIFRDYRINLFTYHNFSHEALDDAASLDSWRRAYTDGNVQLDANFTLLNYHGGDVQLSWQPDRFSRSATRGGPIMREPGSVSGRVGVSTDRQRDTSFNGGVDLSSGLQDSGSSVSVDGTVNLRPTTRFQVEFGPRLRVQSDGSQYVTSTSVLPYEPTFGGRYLFGELEMRTLSLQTRTNYTFSPSLSLQVYAEPFLSSGEYVRYRQLADAGSYDFLEFEAGEAVDTGEAVVCSGGTICRDEAGVQHLDLDGDGVTDFTFNDRDFNVRSLVGNAVLRWEYRPGSTVYFVWQREQERRDNGASEADFRRDLRELWTVPAHDRFIIKVSYWHG